MGIEIACKNGHALNIKDKYAGKTGLCPVCKAFVRVPISDESILELLGQPVAKHQHTGFVVPEVSKRDCGNCRQEIDVRTRICPHCRTYVGL